MNTFQLLKQWARENNGGKVKILLYGGSTVKGYVEPVIEEAEVIMLTNNNGITKAVIDGNAIAGVVYSPLK